MKKKDIIVIVMCALIIAASLYFIFRGFAPKTQGVSTQNRESIEFTGDIDENEIEKLKSRKDYGTPPMDNIGRENPFASL